MKINQRCQPASDAGTKSVNTPFWCIVLKTQRTHTVIRLKTQELEESLYLNGNVTVGASDDAGDGQRDLVLDGPGTIRADEARVVHLREGGPHEIEGLLQSVRVFGAGVQDVGPQLQSGQDAIAGVDFIQGQQHGLQPLDAPLVVDLAAVLHPLAFVVHGEQPSDHQVAVQDDLVLGSRR